MDMHVLEEAGVCVGVGHDGVVSLHAVAQPIHTANGGDTRTHAVAAQCLQHRCELSHRHDALKYTKRLFPFFGCEMGSRICLERVGLSTERVRAHQRDARPPSAREAENRWSVCTNVARSRSQSGRVV